MAGLAPAGATVAVLTSCSVQDAICGGGEYPVLAVGSSGSACIPKGDACVPKGEEPPEGYACYPQGKVPERVGDKWDEYWNTHTIDKDGRTVTLKDGQ
ncbi:hypothetical protein AB0B50_00965 [Streptomyces sp. NPDC041068]|uniref:SCO0607 family lipoprotein n=1 Tax=Streptomyces sp. NPDC041068 TaxID=3155130 RepID=UPI0033EE6B1C